MNNDPITAPAPGTGLLLKLDGTRKVLTPAKPRRGFQFTELYGPLACRTIEVHQLIDGPFKGMLLLFDEEGGFKGEDNFNLQASRLWAEAYPPVEYPYNNGGILWGNVLLTHDKLLK